MCVVSPHSLFFCFCPRVWTNQRTNKRIKRRKEKEDSDKLNSKFLATDDGGIQEFRYNQIKFEFKEEEQEFLI